MESDVKERVFRQVGGLAHVGYIGSAVRETSDCPLLPDQPPQSSLIPGIGPTR